MEITIIKNQMDKKMEHDKEDRKYMAFKFEHDPPSGSIRPSRWSW